MEEIARLLAICKAHYDAGASPLDEVRDLAAYCIGKLAKEATYRAQGSASGGRRRRMATVNEEEAEDEIGTAEVVVPDKAYSVFVADARISRPFLPAMFFHDQAEFVRRWKEVVANFDPEHSVINDDDARVNTVFYTAINAFAICYDLWKPGSRKTPGTFLEILMGSVLGRLLPNRQRTKFIPIPGQVESVSTDISFIEAGGRKGLAFPAKITTRERIVQAFAQQRILDSAFTIGSFRSILLAVSELQRDKNSGVNEICVPGTIRLYQSHLAKMTGIYYLDPPVRYLQADVTSVVPVGSVGYFLTRVLPAIIQPVK